MSSDSIIRKLVRSNIDLRKQIEKLSATPSNNDWVIEELKKQNTLNCELFNKKVLELEKREAEIAELQKIILDNKAVSITTASIKDLINCLMTTEDSIPKETLKLLDLKLSELNLKVISSQQVLTVIEEIITALIDSSDNADYRTFFVAIELENKIIDFLLGLKRLGIIETYTISYDASDKIINKVNVVIQNKTYSVYTLNKVSMV